jgi:hypothetical protein
MFEKEAKGQGTGGPSDGGEKSSDVVDSAGEVEPRPADKPGYFPEGADKRDSAGGGVITKTVLDYIDHIENIVANASSANWALHSQETKGAISDLCDRLRAYIRTGV